MAIESVFNLHVRWNHEPVNRYCNESLIFPLVLQLEPVNVLSVGGSSHFVDRGVDALVIQHHATAALRRLIRPAAVGTQEVVNRGVAALEERWDLRAGGEIRRGRQAFTEQSYTGFKMRQVSEPV